MEEEALAALHQCSPSTATLLPALLTALRESSSTRAFVFEEDQAAALRQLTQLVSESPDQEAIALCEYLRAAGGVQLIAGLTPGSSPCVTGATLAAACSFISLVISAAAFALSSRSTGRLALLGARAADRPDGLDARRRLRLQLAHHLGR